MQDDYIEIDTDKKFAQDNFKNICAEIVKMEEFEAFELLKRLGWLLQYSSEEVGEEEVTFQIEFNRLFSLSAIGVPNGEMIELVSSVISFVKDYVESKSISPKSLISYKNAVESFQKAHTIFSKDPRFANKFDDAVWGWS